MKNTDALTRRERVLNTYIKLLRAADTVTSRLHRHLAGRHLTVSQFAVLEVLFHKGPLCQKEIGEKILKTSGNMTLVIDNLEKRGLVTRKKDADDRRFITVHLTGEGRRLISSIFPVHADIAEQIFSVLDDDELNRLGALLKKLGTSVT
jgi:MarR family 2-MHQ and catechol resistance regulon transcriptional repressor